MHKKYNFFFTCNFEEVEIDWWDDWRTGDGFVDLRRDEKAMNVCVFWVGRDLCVGVGVVQGLGGVLKNKDWNPNQEIKKMWLLGLKKRVFLEYFNG